jgi:hypothetical protein
VEVGNRRVSKGLSGRRTSAITRPGETAAERSEPARPIPARVHRFVLWIEPRERSPMECLRIGACQVVSTPLGVSDSTRGPSLGRHYIREKSLVECDVLRSKSQAPFESSSLR